MSDASDLSPTAPSQPAQFRPAPVASQPIAPAAAPVAPGSKEWAAMTTEQRHEQLRGPPNPRSQGHSPARDTYEAAAAARNGTAAPQQQDPPSADAPQASAEKFKVGKFEVSESEIAGMLDRQAADDLRKATVPPTPNDYKLELSADAKLPGGVEYKFNASDPSLAALRNWAHAKGFDQSTLSEMLTIYATHEAQQNAVLAERSRAEIAKAGVNAPQRVDAIGQWIRSEVGDADAKPILATIVTDAHLRFYEKLQHKITSQGSASFSQQHRVAPDDGKIPGFENMDFAQRRFAQDQAAARRNSR